MHTAAGLVVAVKHISGLDALSPPKGEEKRERKRGRERRRERERGREREENRERAVTSGWMFDYADKGQRGMEMSNMSFKATER